MEKYLTCSSSIDILEHEFIIRYGFNKLQVTGQERGFGYFVSWWLALICGQKRLRFSIRKRCTSMLGYGPSNLFIGKSKQKCTHSNQHTQTLFWLYVLKLPWYFCNLVYSNMYRTIRNIWLLYDIRCHRWRWLYWLFRCLLTSFLRAASLLCHFFLFYFLLLLIILKRMSVSVHNSELYVRLWTLVIRGSIRI